MNGKEDATRVEIPLMGLAPVTVVFATLMVLFLGIDYVANGAMENDGYLRILTLPLAACLLYTSPSPRDRTRSRMPSSA